MITKRKLEGGRLERETDKWIDELVGALTDPLIVYPGGWEDTLPETIKADITTHRLIQQMKHEEGLASWPEVCAYMYCVTLEHPVSSAWAHIYAYAMTQYKGDLMPKDVRQDELRAHEMQDLDRFRRWIYGRRLQWRKERHRIERASESHKEKDERRAQPKPQMALPFVFEAEYEPVTKQS